LKKILSLHIFFKSIYNLANYKGNIRNEWESLRVYDTLFLLTIRPTAYVGDPVDE